jgi:pimeloyl-ACP methyl ester carboxylesterase
MNDTEPTPDRSETRTVELPFGPCRVRLSGGGTTAPGVPILLVHGLLVDGTLWDRVAPGLAERHLVIQPDLPIGAHQLPAVDRSVLHPEGVADALVVLLDRLGVDRAIVVGNDTGGALAQIMTARHPERVAALVLTSCDAFDHFPPTVLKPVVPLLKIPGAIELIGFGYRFRAIRRSWLGVGLLLEHPIDDALIAPWFDRITADRRNRRDISAFLRHCRPALTHAAADALRTFEQPVLLAWSRGDRLFPEGDARRLAELLPDATLAWVEGARTFSVLDQPDRVRELIHAFVDRAGLAVSQDA